MSSTTIRVKSDTRDRLNGFAADFLPGASHDDVIAHLLDEQWKVTCIAQADQRRQDTPAAVREELAHVADVQDLAAEPYEQAA
jgi:hypothetical protein